MAKTPSTIVRRTKIPQSASRPVVTPIFPSVVYASECPDMLDDQYEGRASGYTYAREGHPNADILATKIDMLEGAEGGIVTGSGMSALSAIFLAALKTGDHVLAGDQLYGRSLRLLKQDLPRLGIDATLADPTDAAAFAKAIRPETRMVLLEVVSNPTLRIAEMEAIAALCAARNILLVVDNTFTTPRAFRPFDFGADIIMHSVTKLLAGHSDVTLGYVAAKDPGIRQAMRDVITTWGLTPSPYECWLAERGMHSFELRYDRAEENAAKLAAFLADHKGVEQVLYPGRADHPDHNRATAILGERYGNMVSFTAKGGRQGANILTRTAPEIAFAPTLGDIGTTLSHPASSSHRGLSADERGALGIGEGFFRVSVGIEPVELLIAELDHALNEVFAAL